MAVVPVKKPTLTGVNPLPPITASAADRFLADASAKYLIHVKNGGGSPSVCTVNDPNTPLPAGAAASSTFADVPISVAAAGEQVFLITSPGRFIAADGHIDLAFAPITSVTYQIFEIT